MYQTLLRADALRYLTLQITTAKALGHAMVSNFSNEDMLRYWKGHGFEEVILVNAKDFDDQNQSGEYVDSTHFSFNQRLAWTGAVLEAVDRAAKLALGGTPTAL